MDISEIEKMRATQENLKPQGERQESKKPAVKRREAPRVSPQQRQESTRLRQGKLKKAREAITRFFSSAPEAMGKTMLGEKKPKTPEQLAREEAVMIRAQKGLVETDAQARGRRERVVSPATPEQIAATEAEILKEREALGLAEEAAQEAGEMAADYGVEPTEDEIKQARTEIGIDTSAEKAEQATPLSKEEIEDRKKIEDRRDRERKSSQRVSAASGRAGAYYDSGGQLFEGVDKQSMYKSLEEAIDSRTIVGKKGARTAAAEIIQEFQNKATEQGGAIPPGLAGDVEQLIRFKVQQEGAKRSSDPAFAEMSAKKAKEGIEKIRSKYQDSEIAV